ncbi:hypothetical protein [Glaciimonas sp. PAMC28666]|uniref:hypothetical protein n=1 Tax=Glaciimonas sp. PAMC28666 TaxID=2807626 RepID=UPI001962C863|nr:hypothetical protein [Glaciimonas sp. PAMC28666]QRX81630.1 hypothetical protein JQN73_15930 [Glaciimonas sp. PAMC28666]
MFDGLWYGIFGGLFGPTVAQWLCRFKYWAIFLTAMVSTYIGLYIAGIYTKGLKFATQAMLENIFTPVGILAPMGIGLLAVFVAFVGSLNVIEKPSEDDKNNP